MSDIRLYVLQRLTAALMVPLIAAHLVIIFYASKELTAPEILARTRGSLGWGLFYGLFVVLAATHGAIGVRGVCREWGRLDDRALDLVMWAFGLILLALGLRAVAAVVLP